MRAFFSGMSCHIFSLGIAAATACLACLAPEPAFSQVTQLYTFESGLQGFTANGGQITLSLNENSSFASEGSNSMKVDLTPFSSFDGAAVSPLDLAFNDPPGVDFLRFAFINTTRFAPEMPGPGQPTFADAGITVFAVDPANGNQPVDIQFIGSQVSLGSLEPGTHELEIDLTQGGLRTGPGGGAELKGFNEWFGTDPGEFIPVGFQLYFNKNFGVTGPFAWSFYIDNIRIGQAVEAVDGDYNGNGTVDAADYTVWRDNLGLLDVATVAEGDGDLDGDVTQADYEYWKSRFGNGGGGSISASGVPEPATGMLLFMAACLTGIMMRGGFGRR